MDRRMTDLLIFSVVGFLLLIALPGGVLAQTSEAGKGAAYDVIVARNVMVPMRDGVRLATDIYMPAQGGAAAAGKFPVLVQRTPYGKTPRIPPGTDAIAEKELNAAN